MKYIFVFFLCYTQSTSAQKFNKADKKIVENLKLHINYLANDKLEGRRTGTEGEKLAYEYIISSFSKAGINPYTNSNGYLQNFSVYDGKEMGDKTSFSVNGLTLQLNKDYFPLAYSASGTVRCDIYQSLKERGEIWFYNIADLAKKTVNNPHFDLQEAVTKAVSDYASKGASGIILYNSSTTPDALSFDKKDKTTNAGIPVIYLSKEAKQKYFSDEISMHKLALTVHIENKLRTGHNVIGYINNNAAHTVILGAHYDHLGYGEDHNSLFAGSSPEIHNGADDNASGTAALIELGKLLKASKLKNNNYLLIAFSGEELGLYGSKYFTEHNVMGSDSINYMINMDMVGRLNIDNRGLTVGGYGTSPAWGKLIDSTDSYFKIHLDSSGTGPSDHTSFYRKDIPVLFFFTGTHIDYHKPSDDADKINYPGELQVIKMIFRIIKSADEMKKLAFTKTREVTPMGKSSFKVSLGIMPDYTFSGTGVYVDGISAGKAAEKAGMQAGDIILQMGDFKIKDIQDYMEALGKFNKGDACNLKILRNKKEINVPVQF